VHGMVILIHRFEILNAEVVPLMSGLRENNSLLLLIPLLQSKLDSPWVLFHQIFSFEICMDVVPLLCIRHGTWMIQTMEHLPVWECQLPCTFRVTIDSL